MTQSDRRVERSCPGEIAIAVAGQRGVTDDGDDSTSGQGVSTPAEDRLEAQVVAEKRPATTEWRSQTTSIVFQHRRSGLKTCTAMFFVA